MQGATTAKGGLRVLRALISLALVQCASCTLRGGGLRCFNKAGTIKADDPTFARGPAAATEAAAISATGNVAYVGGSSSLQTSSSVSLDIAWDQSTVSGSYVSCDDGSAEWNGSYVVPVTAKLSTADNVFSSTLTGTVENAADNSGDLWIHFNDLALSDLQGTFSWRDVNGWSNESEVCANVRVRFGALLRKSQTKALIPRDQIPGFINVECPSDTPPAVVFSAITNFN